MLQGDFAMTSPRQRSKAGGWSYAHVDEEIHREK